MNVVFRADASVAIGSGHVMRCLTLAEDLRVHGARVSFICRALPGEMSDAIESRGFNVARLATLDPGSGAAELAHLDALDTGTVIAALGMEVHWLIVDHYALDRSWEMALRDSTRHIMVIDDLADRPHDCDLLLDQNFTNPRHAQYARLLPPNARCLLGTRYALVGADFARARPVALARRAGQLQRVLVTMGGSDPANDTATVLTGLAGHAAAWSSLDVVIGAGNPHRREVADLCNRIPSAELHIQTTRMAELMTRADLAVTGSGSTTWERCVLGLPALVTVQSRDQAASAYSLEQMGAHRVLGWSGTITATDYERAVSALDPRDLTHMSSASAAACDGTGTRRVTSELFSWSTQPA